MPRGRQLTQPGTRAHRIDHLALAAMLRRLLVVAVAALVVAPAALGGTTLQFTPAPTAPVYDSVGRLIGTQVAWKMARGYRGAFGGDKINDPWIWGGFCVVFLLGLLDFRRLASLRNLDLLAFLSFSASLWYFNKGDVFTSAPLVYPPLV